MTKLPETLVHLANRPHCLTFPETSDNVAICVSVTNFSAADDEDLAARVKNRFNACAGSEDMIFPEGWVTRAYTAMVSNDIDAILALIQELDEAQPKPKFSVGDVAAEMKNLLEKLNDNEDLEFYEVNTNDPSNPIVVLTNGQRFRLTITAED